MAPPRKKPPATPLLSGEERALWDYAAASIEPLEKAKPRVATPDLPDPESAPRRRTAIGSKTAMPSTKAAPAATPRKSSRDAEPPSLAEFDRKAAKRLRTGVVEIEQRLDLHGMRQAEAHVALKRFLHACHRKHMKWVLVITGKGAPRAAAEPDSGAFDAPERGVLRRNVPRWLVEPELRSVVVSYTTASITHGGEGALYVELRRNG